MNSYETNMCPPFGKCKILLKFFGDLDLSFKVTISRKWGLSQVLSIVYISAPEPV